jgi:nucleosome assembly protein 1-like 1
MADSSEKTALVEDDHEDMSSGEEEEGDGDKAVAMNAGKVTQMGSLFKDPAVLAALQGKLGSMVGQNSGYIQSLPPQVKRRMKSLKKLQLESTKIESDFYKEVQELECKYQSIYQPLYDKRTQIVKGVYEPTDAEADFPSDSEDEEADLSTDIKDKATIEEIDEKTDKVKETKEEDVKGIPSFWLTIMKNVEMLAEMVQETDEPVLEKLEDVTVKLHSKPQLGFTIYFHFQENEYFNNPVLTKEYEMKCEPLEEDPFSFEGPEIIKCKGCLIDWKKGKNLTVKTVKKKQKHKNKGSVRTITKQVKADSFFNFFDPPQVPDDPKAEVDEETQALLTADFEIGHYINERIVPRAVLYFTGEALEEDSEFDEEESDPDDDDEEDSDADPDFDPSGEKETPECHQQ